GVLRVSPADNSTLPFPARFALVVLPDGAHEVHTVDSTGRVGSRMADLWWDEWPDGRRMGSDRDSAAAVALSVLPRLDSTTVAGAPAAAGAGGGRRGAIGGMGGGGGGGRGGRGGRPTQSTAAPAAAAVGRQATVRPIACAAY